MVSFDTLYTPSHRMITGRKAIFGIGKPIDTIGSKNQRASGSRAIATPSAMPPTAAMAKPSMARPIVTAMLNARSPATASCQMRTSTVLSGGS